MLLVFLMLKKLLVKNIEVSIEIIIMNFLLFSEKILKSFESKNNPT